MTFSEFGRRVDENGDGGTDHGTASPVLVIGDHVNGGLHGAQPSLTNLDNDDNLIPTVDFRRLYSTVLDKWLNADDQAVLGKSYAELDLFTSGPAAPFTGSESGYWLAGPTGSVHGFGSGIKFGSIAHLAKPIVAGAAMPTHKGMWLTTSAGGVFCFGDAKPHGNAGSIHLAKPIVGMAATPTGNGYWLVTAGGGVYAYGDAKSYGTMSGRHFSSPIIGIAATKSGKGYWLVTGGGGVFCFGDATPYGSITGRHLSTPVVDVCTTPTGKGYWLVTGAGGVFPLRRRALPRRAAADLGAGGLDRPHVDRQRVLARRERRHGRRVRRRADARWHQGRHRRTGALLGTNRGRKRRSVAG